ncbi:MAG TPA: hypothetical protein VGG85_12575 [Terracidiphilus sp.]|jgi:hypothetical protein
MSEMNQFPDGADKTDSSWWRGINPLRAGFGRLTGSNRKTKWVVAAIAAMIAIPTAGMIIGYFARPAIGTQGAGDAPVGISADSSSHGTTAKPSAGKPLVAATQPPPPVVTQRAPAPAGLPSQPAAAPSQIQPNAPLGSSALPQIASSLPPSPTVTPNVAYGPVVYPARHDKHFGESCSGQLTLNGSGLDFRCPDDPGAGVQVAINEIGSVDENGIRLNSGKKYHFSIQGMSKGGEQQLFADWLSRVR